MTVFLDTDVLVDCLRGTNPAREWLQNQSGERFQIPGVAAMELIWGCRDQPELQRTRNFISSFEVIWPEPSEFARAYELLAMHR
jgi:predicted nucleic acid-binding protein